MTEATDRSRPGDGSPGSAALERLVARWAAVRPFLLVGSASIVAGGIVAAVTRPTGFERGPWVAAFLVLVAGVAQIALGVGQAWLARDVPSRSEIRVELVTWNAAAVATIVGTLVSAPAVTTLGGIVLVVALARFLAGTRDAIATANVARAIYRGVVAVVLVSVPIGLALAWIRHG